jgi:hypothetical protein
MFTENNLRIYVDADRGNAPQAEAFDCRLGMPQQLCRIVISVAAI